MEFLILKLANMWGRGVVSGDKFWGSYRIDEDCQPEERRENTGYKRVMELCNYKCKAEIVISLYIRVYQ